MRSEKTMANHLFTKKAFMLILIRFRIMTVLNLRFGAIRLYVESAKYGVKELKGYHLYPCHSIL